jgi:hypothetical protein
MSVNGQHDRLNGYNEGEIPAARATGKQIEAAMNRSIRQALRRHKLLGESIAVSRDGKVVILPPEEIPDFPEDEPAGR